MKKIKALLFLAFCLFSKDAVAGVIDLPSYLSGNDVTITNLNTSNTTTENWANGNVEGGTNIKAGSLVTPDFSVAVSPVTRWDEAFSDFTYTGMLPATDSDLTSDISAGTSYVAGYRVQKAAESHTYTASKDTYVWINKGGNYVFVEVANGGAAPSTPTPTADHLLLATVVTNGTQITSVTDSRTTGIQLTVGSSVFPAHYRNQAFVSRDSTTNFHAEPGSVAIGNTMYTRTSDTSSKSVLTGSNWIEGLPDSDPPFLCFVYAYNDTGTSWDIKFSSADVTASDTASGTGGTLRYYSTGGVTYRAIGWFYLSTDAVRSNDWGNFPDIGVKNKSFFQYTTAQSCTTQIPTDSTPPLITEGNEVMYSRFYVSNANSSVKAKARAVISAGGACAVSQAIFMDTVGSATSATSSTIGAADNYDTLPTDAEFLSLSRGIHTFKVRVGPDSAQTVYINQDSGSQTFASAAGTTLEIYEE